MKSKFNKEGNKRERNARGSAAFELAAGSTIVIAIVALSLNICFAMMSYGINDRACRDAARAAAQGGSRQEATQLANAIIRSYNTNNGVLAPIVVDQLSYNDFGGNPPAEQSPFVTVVTRTTAKLPAPIELLGQRIFGTTLPVRKQYSFPIVKLTVNT